MSYKERLLREYVRILLNEKLTQSGGTDKSGTPGKRREMDLPAYHEDKPGHELAACDSISGCIAALLGRPQSAVDAVNAIFGEEGLFNLSAIWKDDVSFLGENTLKPAWDYMMETLSGEFMGERPTYGEDFWSNMFGRTGSAVGAAGVGVAAVADVEETPEETEDVDCSEEQTLADRISCEAEQDRLGESVSLMFEGDDPAGENIVSALSADISDITSSISSIQESDNIIEAMKEFHKLFGETGDYQKIYDAMTAAAGSFDKDELLSVFVDKIIPETMRYIVDFMRTSIVNVEPGSFAYTLSPYTRATMIEILENFHASL